MILEWFKKVFGADLQASERDIHAMFDRIHNAEMALFKHLHSAEKALEQRLDSLHQETATVRAAFTDALKEIENEALHAENMLSTVKTYKSLHSVDVRVAQNDKQ